MLQFEQNFRSVYLFCFMSSLVLDDHSMLSSCQTWHSVSINIARCCIVSFFIINFFFSIVASEQKDLPQAEFHCFYIMFLNDSCSKTMIYTNKSNWQPRYYFFQFIRKLFLFFYVLFANYQTFFTSNNIIQIFYLYIFFLLLLCHIRLLLKLILVFITKKY